MENASIPQLLEIDVYSRRKHLFENLRRRDFSVADGSDIAFTLAPDGSKVVRELGVVSKNVVVESNPSDGNSVRMGHNDSVLECRN